MVRQPRVSSAQTPPPVLRQFYLLWLCPQPSVARPSMRVTILREKCCAKKSPARTRAIGPSMGVLELVLLVTIVFYVLKYAGIKLGVFVHYLSSERKQCPRLVVSRRQSCIFARKTFLAGTHDCTLLEGIPLVIYCLRSLDVCGVRWGGASRLHFTFGSRFCRLSYINATVRAGIIRRRARLGLYVCFCVLLVLRFHVCSLN